MVNYTNKFYDHLPLPASSSSRALKLWNQLKKILNQEIKYWALVFKNNLKITV